MEKIDIGGTFKIVGIITSPDFQRCRVYCERLHKSFPEKYPKPNVRGLLNVEWERYITKLKRTVGKRLWSLNKQVVVFLNDEYLGDDQDVMAYISGKYYMTLEMDFCQIGKQQLIESLEKETKKGRQYAYLTVSIDKKAVGTMLFLLYSDLVPITCSRFLYKCKTRKNGFAGTPIHRIVTGSWIQCGGYDLKHHRMPCENYIVPHDSRGVLFMCHGGKHQDNSYQFGISLTPQPWMNYKYVAFGQLIQGTEVLALIEQIPDYYESPSRELTILTTGEFSLYPSVDKKTVKEMDEYLKNVHPATGLHIDVIDPTEKPSGVWDVRRYREGLYGLGSDMQSHLPFLHLPDYLVAYLCLRPKEEVEGEEDSQSLSAGDTTTETTKLTETTIHEDTTFKTQSEASGTQVVRDILKETLSTVFEEPEFE